MNEADVLEQAADLIESVGHCKMQARTRENDMVVAYCALGAIGAVDTEGLSNAAALKLSDALGEVPGIDVSVFTCDCSMCNRGYTLATSRIAQWNDDEARTAEEVVEKMKQVAKDLRNTAA